MQGNFNSCMVRLKVVHDLKIEATEDYFNSCMVRLKVHRCLPISLPVTVFQFLYGTIKGFFITMNMILFILISIPVWYD